MMIHTSDGCTGLFLDVIIIKLFKQCFMSELKLYTLLI